MRKLILGVSLWWPIIVTLTLTAVAVVAFRDNDKWGGLIPQIPLWGGIAFHVYIWLPYYRNSKFGVAMMDDINTTYQRIAQNYGDVYGQMSLSERIYDKLCRLR
jgi:hypothetical protein